MPSVEIFKSLSLLKTSFQTLLAASGFANKPAISASTIPFVAAFILLANAG